LSAGITRTATPGNIIDLGSKIGLNQGDVDGGEYGTFRTVLQFAYASFAGYAKAAAKIARSSGASGAGAEPAIGIHAGDPEFILPRTDCRVIGNPVRINTPVVGLPVLGIIDNSLNRVETGNVTDVYTTGVKTRSGQPDIGHVAVSVCSINPDLIAQVELCLCNPGRILG